MENQGEENRDPLALEAITERRLVAAFLEFLKNKSQKSETSERTKGILEAARINLLQAFDLSEERVGILRPQVPLLDIFATHPDATPADPRQVLETELTRTPAASEEAKAKAEEFKNKGNDLLKANQVDEALAAYTEALNLDPTNPILYCNRAAAYSKKNQHDLAAKDCEIALAFDSKYAKAYGRYGLALHGLGLLKEAKEALEKAVSLDPENQLYKNNLKLVEDAILAASGNDQGAGGQMPGGFPGMPGGFPGMPGGFPGMGGLPGGLPSGVFDMLGNQDFQQTMMQMMQNPQVQQMVGQFSSMFMSQMAPGAAGGPAAGAGAGTPPPNMDDLLRQGIGGITPEQIAEQMRSLFGGGLPGQQPPPDNTDNSNQKPDDKDKDKKGPDGSGGPPSYFS